MGRNTPPFKRRMVVQGRSLLKAPQGGSWRVREACPCLKFVAVVREIGVDGLREAKKPGGHPRGNDEELELCLRSLHLQNEDSCGLA